MSFESAFQKTVLLEGYYSDNPQDRGGETKWGISRRAYPYEDIPNLTLERAKEIYRSDFWDKMRLDEISNPIIQDEIFDTAVNCGPWTASLVIQRAINFLSNRPVLAEDGMIGAQTIYQANFWCRKDPIALFKALNGFQFIHYVNITKKDPNHCFPHGWMKRVQEYSTSRA